MASEQTKGNGKFFNLHLKNGKASINAMSVHRKTMSEFSIFGSNTDSAIETFFEGA